MYNLIPNDNFGVAGTRRISFLETRQSQLFRTSCYSAANANKDTGSELYGVMCCLYLVRMGFLNDFNLKRKRKIPHLTLFSPCPASIQINSGLTNYTSEILTVKYVQFEPRDFMPREV